MIAASRNYVFTMSSLCRLRPAIMSWQRAPGHCYRTDQSNTQEAWQPVKGLNPAMTPVQVGFEISEASETNENQ